jgi:hypothetical protein
MLIVISLLLLSKPYAFLHIMVGHKLCVFFGSIKLNFVRQWSVVFPVGCIVIVLQFVRCKAEKMAFQVTEFFLRSRRLCYNCEIIMLIVAVRL